jgi:uncharacterized protein
MINWVKRSPVMAYFVLIFSVEWVLVLTLSRITPPMLALLIGSWLPDCIGVFITGISAGRLGLRELFSKVILWRIGLRWYATAILLPAIMAWISIGLYTIINHNLPDFAPSNQLFLVFLGAVFTGALGEELGWRGTALPRMQTRWSPLISSLILGFLWGLYHLPSFLLSGLPLKNMPLIPFMISALGLTIIVTWTFNHTKGSLILVFLYHFSFNFIGNAFGIFGYPALFWMLTISMMSMAVAIIFLDKKRFTTRATISTEGTWLIFYDHST